MTLTLANLDESIGGDPGDDADGDGPDDDVPGNTDPDPTGTNPFGRVVTAVRDGETPGDLEALFDVTKDPGTDGEKSVAHALSLTLTGAGDGVATVLSVTDPGDDFFDATISLFVVDSTIEGRFQVTEGDWGVALRISLGNEDSLTDATLTVEQFMPIDHGDDGNLFDASLALLLVEAEDLLGVTLTTTLTDGDDDVARYVHCAPAVRL